jgi:hypothetical protein
MMGGLQNFNNPKPKNAPNNPANKFARFSTPPLTATLGWDFTWGGSLEPQLQQTNLQCQRLLNICGKPTLKLFHYLEIFQSLPG